jgi:hypothetical protein
MSWYGICFQALQRTLEHFSKVVGGGFRRMFRVWRVPIFIVSLVEDQMNFSRKHGLTLLVLTVALVAVLNVDASAFERRFCRRQVNYRCNSCCTYQYCCGGYHHGYVNHGGYGQTYGWNNGGHCRCNTFVNGCAYMIPSNSGYYTSGFGETSGALENGTITHSAQEAGTEVSQLSYTAGADVHQRNQVQAKPVSNAKISGTNRVSAETTQENVRDRESDRAASNGLEPVPSTNDSSSSDENVTDDANP